MLANCGERARLAGEGLKCVTVVAAVRRGIALSTAHFRRVMVAHLASGGQPAHA